MTTAAAPTSPEPAPLPRRLKGHVPVLDGVRGLAILAVVILHVTGRIDHPEGGTLDWWVWTIFHTGWMGVDLFFVLSGYLITGILCDTRAAENYFGSFYGRRALRIFPLFYIFLTAVWIAFRMTKTGEYPFGAPAWWYFLYLQNYVMFSPAIEFVPGVIGITWSLAVEEQFYLVWPLLVRKLTRQNMIRLCVAIIVLQPVLRQLLYSFASERWILNAYCTTPTRMDGLAIGALIALILREDGGLARLAKWARVMLPVGVIGTLVCFFLIGEAEPRTYPFGVYGYTTVALAFGGFLIFALGAREESLLSRALSGKFLGLWGKYSYAIYLWHAILIRGLEKGLYKPLLGETTPRVLGSVLPVMALEVVVTGALSLGAGWLSWQLIEKHFLALKDRFKAKKEGAGEH